MSTNHNARAENIETPYTELTSTASKVASEIGGDIKRGVGELGSAVKNLSSGAMRQIEEKGRAALESATGKAEEASRYLEREVRKAPLISVGIAFGLGLAMSRILFRRS